MNSSKDLIYLAVLAMLPTLLGSERFAVQRPAPMPGTVAGWRVFRDFRTLTGHSFLRRAERIVEGRDGRHWAFSQFHVSVYDSMEDRWIRRFADITWPPQVLMLGVDGLIWYAPADSSEPSLLEHDGRAWRKIVYPVKRALTKTSRRATAFRGAKQRVWFVYDGHIVRYDGQWGRPEPLPRFTDSELSFNRGLEDQDGAIWLCAWEEYQLPRFITNSDGKPEMQRGPKWRNGSAVVCVSSSRDKVKVFFAGKDSEPATRAEDVSISVIYEDRFGRLWFGGRQHSVFVYSKRENTWLQYNLRNELESQQRITIKPPEEAPPMSLLYYPPPPFSVTAICEDPTGRFLFGTLNGLIVFDEKRNTWEQFVPENSGLSCREIYSLNVDSRSRLWVGTGYGVMVLAPDGG